MISQSRPSRSRGFTLVEVLLVSVAAVLLLGIGLALLRSVLQVSMHDRIEAQLVTTHRRNLEYLTNVLRNAEVSSLGGFDEATSASSSPRFRRPTGAVNSVRQMGAEEQLVWRPSVTPVSGVAHPGAVWLVRPAGDELAADRVPKGGFEVRQLGRTLTVRITTYRPMGGGDAVRISSTTSASPRN